MSLEQELAPFDYDLPDECIAVHPLAERSESKLLVLDNSDQHIDSFVSRINECFKPGDVLVLNNTRVLHARVSARRASGGKVEAFFLQDKPDSEGCYTALMKPSRRLKEGEVLTVERLDATIRLLERQDDGQWRIKPSIPAGQLMSEAGDVPIPPYLKRESQISDQERYQTVMSL